MEKVVTISVTPQQREMFNQPFKFTYVKKGRRLGFTKGASMYCVKWLLNNTAPILWVDTINGNIDRYFDRYFAPVLKENNIDYNFNRQKRQLTVGNNYIDFRSADRPESIEGFGYRKIILNEAGIILKNDYLWTNAILPMLIDYPDSQLIAGGAPKGSYKKDGTEHLFYTLCNREAGNSKVLTYSSYDNPTLRKEDIEVLEREIMAMSPQDVRQEIYGEFIDKAGSNPFIYSTFTEEPITYDPRKPLYIGMDFNLNPFGFIYAHIFKDNEGVHVWVIDEESIPNANLDKGIDAIRLKYSKSIPGMQITGDSMGNRRDFGQKDNATYYQRLESALNLRKGQLMLPPNPTHENSRFDCNYALTHFDVRVSSNCTGLIRDLKTVQCDAFGSILKKNRNDVTQQADLLDGFRYLVNAFLFDYIRKHQKGIL